jgi:hypothetical protein
MSRRLREETNERSTFVLQRRSNPSALHKVIFCVKFDHKDALEAEFLERSTPGTSLYQKWLTSDELKAKYEAGNAHHVEKVKEWLTTEGIDVSGESGSDHVHISLRGEYISVTSTVANWERLLQTEFYDHTDLARYFIIIYILLCICLSESHFYLFIFIYIRNNHNDNTIIIRASEYTIPSYLINHITCIMNTVQIPGVMNHMSHIRSILNSKYKKQMKSETETETEYGRDSDNLVNINEHINTQQHRDRTMSIQSSAGSCDTSNIPYVCPNTWSSPANLNVLYQIMSNNGSAAFNQSVFEWEGGNYSV